ncbi:MAG: hypothetical protein WCI04_07375, partial [archaeon]
MFCLFNTVKIKKDIEMSKASIKIDEAKTTAKGITTYDIITAKRTIESYAISNNLPLEIEQSGKTLKISPSKTFNTDMSITNKTIINKYDKVIEFLLSVSA